MEHGFEYGNASTRRRVRLTGMTAPTGTSVAFAGPLIESQLAWSALRGHGIEAWLLNQNANNTPLLDEVEVRVRDEHLRAALEVLEALDKGSG
jgi:hypothetical protein